ncbi:hypothetical protein Pelo_9681 [Pelomyxa schiedti]|nr:hypothetical protein Pelo_9681 [Pelomyxa schiedti]
MKDFAVERINELSHSASIQADLAAKYINENICSKAGRSAFTPTDISKHDLVLSADSWQALSKAMVSHKDITLQITADISVEKVCMRSWFYWCGKLASSTTRIDSAAKMREFLVSQLQKVRQKFQNSFIDALTKWKEHLIQKSREHINIFRATALVNTSEEVDVKLDEYDRAFETLTFRICTVLQKRFGLNNCIPTDVSTLSEALPSPPNLLPHTPLLSRRDLRSPSKFSDHLTCRGLLGTGGTSLVFEVESKDFPGKKLALKATPMCLEGRTTAQTVMKTRIGHEVHILSLVGEHPNIIHLLSSGCDSLGKGFLDYILSIAQWFKDEFEHSSSIYLSLYEKYDTTLDSVPPSVFTLSTAICASGSVVTHSGT